MIKFLIWNCHSVRGKLDELTSFMSSHSIDVALLSETWLVAGTNFFIPGYTIFRADRYKGGAAILIRSNIPHNHISTKSMGFAESISTVLRINNSNIRVSAIYISPAASRAQSTSFFSYLLNRPGQHLIGGDFNCKHVAWNNTKSCYKGVDLFNLCTKFNFDIVRPDQPTHIPYKGKLSTIDFALSRSYLNLSNAVTINDLSSDHLPVVLSSGSFTLNEEMSFNFAKANWRKLCSVVESRLETEQLAPSSREEIDTSISSLTDIITDGIEQAVPKHKKNIQRYKFSSRIEMLVKNRNYFRRLYQRTGLAAYKSCTNQLNRQIRREIWEEKKELLNAKLGSLTYADNSLFRVSKSLKHRKSLIPPLEMNDFRAYTDADKAEMLASTYLEVHQSSANSISKHDAIVKESIEALPQRQSDLVEEARPEEITKILCSLKVKKAAGPDSIPNGALRALCSCRRFVALLCSIFNQCLSLSYFPPEWKKAEILPIPKSSPASSNPSDYRPISLLSTLSKVFERIILDRLNAFEAENSITIQQQFGFKPKHSTVQQIMRITESVTMGFNKNRSTGMVLLDLRKAYDSVWIDGLVFKLMKFKYPIYLVKLVSSFLNGRSAHVRVGEVKSSEFLIPAGVPQGSIIAPHLFNVFINDIPIPKKGKLALFADDTAFIVDSSWKNLAYIKKHLLDALISFHSFFLEWKIFLNNSKTEFIMFSKSRVMLDKCSKDNILFNNHSLKWKPHVKYLGVVLDSKLLFKHHIDHIISKANGITFKKLYCLIGRKSRVSVDCKIRLFKAVIRPILSYACPVFVNCAKSHLNKIQTFQNKVLRIMLNVKWSDFIPNEKIHMDGKIPEILPFFIKITNKFYSSCNNHENPLINSLGQYDYNSLEFRLKHNLPKPSA